MQFFKKLALGLTILALFMGIKPVLADNHSTLATGGVGGWLNVNRPLTEADMKGRLVLLDFWTYGCINCIQIVPDLKFLEEKYGDKLLIIGVHSAKFKGEQGSSRILSAAKRFGLEHPVINDSDFSIWKKFNVKAWPTLVLLGANGREISRYEGEGHRNALDKDIAPLIKGVTNANPMNFISKKQEKTVLAFPARIKKYGDLLYIADSGHGRIIAVDETGKIVKTFDGFHNPRGFAVEGDALFVADTEVHHLVRVDISTGDKEILGGDGSRGRTWASPWDIDVSKDNALIIAMAGTHKLQRFDTHRKNSDVYAGDGHEALKDGGRNDASLAQPSAIAVADNGDVYFVDAESSALRVVSNDKVKTLIGTGLFDFGLKDGNRTNALMQHPQGLSIAGDKIYVADTYNNVIRIYDISAQKLSTLKTTGETMNEPNSIWVDGNKAWITDTNNNRILKLDLRNNVLSDFPVIQSRAQSR